MFVLSPIDVKWTIFSINVKSSTKYVPGLNTIVSPLFALSIASCIVEYSFGTNLICGDEKELKQDKFSSELWICAQGLYWHIPSSMLAEES